MSLIKVVLLLSLSLSSIVLAKEHFVSLKGSSSGDGTIQKPWDLKTALSHPAQVVAGDTIYLRAGRYYGGFISYLSGKEGAPIHVRPYQNEHVILDGAGSFAPDVLGVEGEHTWFWDLEVTSTNSDRYSANPGSHPNWSEVPASSGVRVIAPHVKLINIMVHNTRLGFAIWKSASGTEIHGSMSFNNGWNAPDRLHGHGVYTQNNLENDPKIFENNIIFGNYGHGISAYGSSTAPIHHYLFKNNIFFSERIIIGGEGLEMLSDIRWEENFNYGQTVGLGYGKKMNIDAEVIGNYFVNSSMQARNFHDFRSENNFIYSPGYSPLVIVTTAGEGFEHWTFENNEYYSPLNIKNDGHRQYTFPEWQDSGYDLSSTLSKDSPTGVKVFVKPNKFEKGRANIVVINFDDVTSVKADVSNVLKSGEHWVLYNAFDPLSAPIAKGRYDGSPLTLSVQGLKMARPTDGGASHIGLTRMFNAFILRKDKSVLENQLPQGYLDSLASGKASGWAADLNSCQSSKAVSYEVYIDGTATSKSAPIATKETDLHRSDVNQAKGCTGKHGFNYYIPSSYKDGKPHTLRIYAVDTETKERVELNHSPKTFTLLDLRRRKVVAPPVDFPIVKPLPYPHPILKRGPIIYRPTPVYQVKPIRSPFTPRSNNRLLIYRPHSSRTRSLR